MSLTRVGQYRIIRLLGEGGMGRVYEAIHESIERRVAIKVLHAEYARKPEMLRRFMNEARAVNRINHPALVQISDHGQLPDKTAYIVMEFLDGQTLTAKLEASGKRLSVLKMLQLGQQASTALAAAHAKSIVHRDLKPDNIMLVRDDLAPGGERVKILDFGIAKLNDSTPQGNGRTATGAIMGTPRYMSPEQCRGLHVTEKADVYSLGIVLYQVLGGRTPFDAQEQLAVLIQHIQEPPPPLCNLAPQTPLPLAELIECMLRKDPTERPTMAVISEALAKIEASLLSASGPPVHSFDAKPDQKAIAAISPKDPQTEVQPRRSTLGISVGETLRAIRARRWRHLGAGLTAIGLVCGLSYAKYSLNTSARKAPPPNSNIINENAALESSTIAESAKRQTEGLAALQSSPLKLNHNEQPAPIMPELPHSQVDQTTLNKTRQIQQKAAIERKIISENTTKKLIRKTPGPQRTQVTLALNDYVPCFEDDKFRGYMSKGEYYTKANRPEEAKTFFEMALLHCRHPKTAKAIESIIAQPSESINFFKYYQNHYSPTGLLKSYITERISAVQ